ncbi:MAG: hypothetical protein P0Y53_09610 [Candidatus Pseudobacter hemicellulosilyticus]|uniref:Uncharacterized protein n=1 Tax=Candidatus Pseudobacter hemicellulosilyticus TaxID=3121375 RepID=A0AAJ6BHY5_9BACT|nr:MAG: hypothetical protein P0Y53_09610 [Pseudobacter sp.]
MKKPFNLRLLFTLPVLLLVQAGFSQVTEPASPGTGQPATEPVTAYKAVDNSLPFRNNVPAPALRHFTKTFSPQCGESWYPIKNGFMAKCVVNNINTRVDYDHRGQWICTLTYYEEPLMSADLRARIKSTWYDHRIVLVEQLEFPSIPTVYVVHINLDREWKRIRVQEGDMEELPLLVSKRK